jgi:hypothetical protein
VPAFANRLRDGSSSFLKKRTKKLLSVAPGMGATRVASRVRVGNKIFLVLFLKKELLPCFRRY